MSRIPYESDRDIDAGLIAILLARSQGPSTSGVAASVANATALSNLSTTPLLLGAFAYVASYGAYFSLQPSQPLDPDVILPSTNPSLVWARVLTAVAEKSQLQANWQFDAVSGSNENIGLPGHPLKSQAELVRRYGTSNPYLNQATSFNYLNDPTDTYLLKPTFGPNGSLTFTGALTQVATATIATVTPNTSSTGYTSLTFSSYVGEAPAADLYVHDTTSNCYFFLSADLGGGNWRVTNPHGSPLAQPQPYVTPAPGDNLIFFQQVVIPAISIDCEGLGAGGIFLQQVSFMAADFLLSFGSFVTASDCAFPQSLIFTPEVVQLPFFFGCRFGGVFGTGGAAGASLFVSGGEIAGAAPFLTNGSVLDGDVIIAEDLDFEGSQLSIGRAYLGMTPDTLNPSGLVLITPRTGAAHLRGPAGLNVTNGVRVCLSGVSATSALQLTGTLQIDSTTTAFEFNTSTGSYTTPATTITPGAIDSSGSLSNPKTGSRIYVQ